MLSVGNATWDSLAKKLMYPSVLPEVLPQNIMLGGMYASNICQNFCRVIQPHGKMVHPTEGLNIS